MEQFFIITDEATGGYLFSGTIEQFSDTFFSANDDDEIQDWCDKEGNILYTFYERKEIDKIMALNNKAFDIMVSRLSHVRNLKTGDAFWYKNGKKAQEDIYLAFSLTADPFEVWCLNTRTHKLEEIEEGEIIERLNGWEIKEIKSDVRGESLEVL